MTPRPEQQEQVSTLSEEAILSQDLSGGEVCVTRKSLTTSTTFSNSACHFSQNLHPVVAWIDQVTAAHQHDPQESAAQTMLEYCHEIMNEGTLNFDATDLQGGFDFYLSVAHQGMATGQFYVGICYLQGILNEIQPNPEQAVEWLSRASQHGHVGGHYGLAECLAEGNGISQDFERALELYHLSAKHEHAGAFYALGIFYLHGLGMEQANAETAIVWLKRAADKNVAKAHHLLGKYYLAGGEAGMMMIAQDIEKAKVCFETAVEQGFAPALHTLALLYFHGAGSIVPQDLPKAVEYLTRAAAADFDIAESQWKLACCYANGIGGLTRNLHAALECYIRAAAPRQQRNDDETDHVQQQQPQHVQAMLDLALFCVMHGSW